MSNIDSPSASHPDAPADGWYYNRDGDTVGPMMRAELQGFIDSGPSGRILVWHPSLTDWLPVEQSIFNPVPPVLPPRVRPPPLLPPPVIGPIGDPARSTEAQPGFWAMLFSFTGRAGRRRYAAYSVLVAAVLVSFTIVVMGATGLPLASPDGLAVRGLVALPFIWMAMAVTSKRLHDMGMSAWHLLWIGAGDYLPNLAPSGPEQIITGIGSLAVTIWLLLKRGQTGPNAYGPDPFGSTAQPMVAAAGVADPKGHPIRNGMLMGLVAIVVIGVAAFGLAGIEDAAVPSCASKEVTDKVRQITASNPVFAIMVGAYHDNFSIDDPRTLSDSEPMNGRTCVATLAVRDGENRASVISSQQITYTVQNVDGQGGRYVVSLEQ